VQSEEATLICVTVSATIGVGSSAEKRDTVYWPTDSFVGAHIVASNRSREHDPNLNCYIELFGDSADMEALAESGLLKTQPS
jgi:hypothetical protein